MIRKTEKSCTPALPQLPARERLRQFLTRNPGATAAAAARALNVSRQRIHQLAAEEGFELEKYTTQYPETRERIGGPTIVTHVTPSIDELTGHGKPAHGAAVLRVAADLAALGFDVYVPLNRRQDAADLVIVHPESYDVERVVVDITALRGQVEDPNDRTVERRRLAIVQGDRPIVYRPPFRPPRPKARAEDHPPAS
jgi:hypothetical protein